MRIIDFFPLFRRSAGFDRMRRLLDAAVQMDPSTNSYPPYDVVQAGEDNYRISLAVPGFSDNDLFGTTVQLSARIVDKAKADQIFVSEIVRGICAGKNYKFINRGGFPMKGFGDDVILYEVVWNEAMAGQAAAAASQGQGRNFAPVQQQRPAAQGAKPA